MPREERRTKLLSTTGCCGASSSVVFEVKNEEERENELLSTTGCCGVCCGENERTRFDEDEKEN